jgi:hypothetical protein
LGLRPEVELGQKLGVGNRVSLKCDMGRALAVVCAIADSATARSGPTENIDTGIEESL